METWWPTYYNWNKEIVQVTPTDSIFRLDFTGHEDITNTSFIGPDYIIKKARPVGISENGLEKRTKDLFTPYPNPTHSGKMNVRINPNSENIKNIYWEAYDLAGRLVDNSKEKISPEMREFDIDLSGKANGMYSIVFTGDNGKKLLEVDKVIVNKK